MKWLILGLVLVGVAMIGIRLAPSDPGRWHEMPAAVTDRDLSNSAMRRIDRGAEAFEKLDAIIRETPRTQILAGSVAEEMVTYVTRTAVFGFPDYTTLRREGDRVEIYGRSRFGSSDLGVNAKRIDGWLEALAQRGG